VLRILIVLAIILGFFVENIVTASHQEEHKVFLAKNGFITEELDETFHSNTVLGNQECSSYDFDLFILTDALSHAILWGKDYLKKYPKAIGYQVKYSYKISSYSNSGEEKVRQYFFFTAQIKISGIRKINSKFASRLEDAAFAVQCGGFSLPRFDESQLSIYLRVFKANGGKISYNPKYFGLKIANANILR
jgi:hypothetical protein